MATPWEDTIVIALRDAQWLDFNALNREANDAAPMRPPTFIKLDHDPEQALGDLVYQADERFFLFEVKSSSSRISSEWSDDSPKRLFDSLACLIEDRQSNASEAFEQALWTSLRAHHVVYWSQHVHDTDDMMGNIFLEPYMIACRRRGAPRMSDPALDSMKLVELIEHDCLSESFRLPFSSIRKRSGFVADSPNHIGDSTFMPLGEDLNRFRDYVEYLTKAGGGSEQIRAVLLSDRGFTKVVTSFRDLAEQLNPTNKKQKRLVQRNERQIHQVPTQLVRDLKESRYRLLENRPGFPPPRPRAAVTPKKPGL